jgi:hypothetical protein
MAPQSYTFLVSFPAFTRWHAIFEGHWTQPAGQLPVSLEARQTPPFRPVHSHSTSHPLARRSAANRVVSEPTAPANFGVDGGFDDMGNDDYSFLAGTFAIILSDCPGYPVRAH